VARGGAIPDTLPFWGFVGTATDPSQAPPGQDVLYLWTPFVPLRPALAPDEFKRRAGDALVATAATFYDGITTQEIGRVVAGSADIAAKYQVPNGCIEHVDLVLGRMGPLRPARGLGAYRTPVRGLYLSGNGTHPGLGVSGIPGQLAARELLRTVHSGHRTNWSAATGSFTSG
jgi:phytoene dehydrogenase-like protein